MIANELKATKPVEDKVETMDKERRRWLTYLFGLLCLLILILLVTETEDVNIFMSCILILSIPLVIKFVKLSKKIRNDPELDAALNNELVKMYQLQSWRNAFLVSIAALFVLSFIITWKMGMGWICMFVSVVGFAAYVGSFLFYDSE